MKDTPNTVVEFKNHFRELYNSDLTVSGYSFRWLTFDDRKFSDIILKWSEKYKDADQFIKSIGLSGELTKADLVDLIAETKSPSEKLVYNLSTKVPSDLITWKSFIFRGKNAIQPNKEQVTISEEAMKRDRSQTIKDIASSKSASKEDSYFTEWLTDKIIDMAKHYNKQVDIEKSLAGIAKILDITVAQLKAEDKIPDKLIPEKVEKLANLFGGEGKKFDNTIEQATGAWQSASEAVSPASYTRIVRYLRHSSGMTQKRFSKTIGTLMPNIGRMETGVSIEKDDINLSMFKALNLTPDDQKIIADCYEKYKKAVAQNFYEKNAPLIKCFSRLGLSKEHYLDLAITNPSLFYYSPEKVFSNIQTVADHFKDYGLTFENYLKAATKNPALFCRDPETIITNIEDVNNRFKDKGFKLEDYLKRAVSNPRIFASSAEPIIKKIELIIDMYEKNVFAYRKEDGNAFGANSQDGKDLENLFHFITHSPVITDSADNLKTKFLASALDKYTNKKTPYTKNLSSTKQQLMDKLLGYFNEENDGKETPGSFVSAQLLKRKTPLESTKTESWSKRASSPIPQENSPSLPLR